jgi:hypothetical protein
MRVTPPTTQNPQIRCARKFLAKMKRGLQDCVISVLSDSTGNDVNEWVYLLGQWLGVQFPAYTVVYRLYNNSTGTYDSPVTLQTGTGSKTLTIYNAAVPGALCYYPQITGFNTQIPTSPDVCILNYGHNEQPHTTEADGLMFGSRYSALLMRLSSAFPDCEIFCVIQNPQKNNNYQQLRAGVIQDIASGMGIGTVDWQSLFLANPTWDLDWMGDTVHPNALGQSSACLPSAQLIFSEQFVGPMTPISSGIIPVSNLLLNGDFSTYTSSPGVPGSWTSAGTGVTVSKDLVNFETAGWGTKIVTGAGAPGWIQQNVDLTKYPINQFQNRLMTLLVRLRRPATNTSNFSGRIQLYDGLTSVSSIQSFLAQTDPSFYWECVTMRISASATMVRAYLYADTASTGAQEATFDRAILVRGRIPRDLYL